MDHSPWVVLGVTPGADAAEIRSAYAKRLKEIRPDEDAQGFQRLVEARDLALQLTSGARLDARLAHAIPPVTFRSPANDTLQPQYEPDIPPSPRATPDPLTADPSLETSTEPQDILDALQRTLAAKDLAGWQTVVRATSELTPRQRAALEVPLIESLSLFAAQDSPNCAAWPPDKWPFFTLVAALDEEFGWRENDRLLHGVLDEQEVRDFITLLQWARNLASVGTGARTDVDSRGGPAPIALRDLQQFYDGGRDRQGLDAYWLMVNDPSLWRAHDAATYLFFPGWSLQDGRYGRALLGLSGWIALILAFAPWRSAAVTNALPPALPKGGLGVIAAIPPMVVALWYLIDSTPPRSPHRKAHVVGPLWDSLAFFAFPLWALVRRLYGRAAVGVIAWIAIVYQVRTFEHDLGLLAAIMLVGMFHLTAGEYGQRWVVYKLQRSVAAADRHGIFDAKQRSDFLRRHGTRNLRLSRERSRPETARDRRTRSQDGQPWWWKWLLAFAVISAIFRAIDAFWFRG
jgi:hypothetical protein